MADPIPIDEARRKRGKRKLPDAGTPEDPCPVVALGHVENEVVLLDASGKERRLNGRQLISVGDLSLLFGGDDAWLMKSFPHKKIVRKKVDDEEIIEERTMGFNALVAGQYLIRAAFAAGLFGPHVIFRRPGIWRGADDAPVVHAGNAVLVDGEWRRAGYRSGDIVWAAYASEPRPGAPCSREVVEQIQSDIRGLWQFRHPGGEIATLGLIACGHLGQALATRPNGFLTGGTNSGKTMLLNLMRACAPQHHFTTDTTKAGLEQSIDGTAVPSFVDESSDRRGDGQGAERLLDIVLGATSGDGARIHRGTAGGKVRSINLASVITMAATNPPELLPQHLRRFTIIELMRPAEGADNAAAQHAATARCAAAGAALWGRTLAAWPRWPAVVAVYREALARSRYDVSAMDQAAAWLAGWWVLVEDGVPSAAQALDGVGAVASYLRIASEVADDDAPRRMLRHLASTLVQRQHTTDRMPIAVLADRAWGADADADYSRTLLAGYGIRIVRASDDRVNGKAVSRRGDGDGMWFAIGARPLREMFEGVPELEKNKWVYEVMRLPSAVRSGAQNIRVGKLVGPAIWLSRHDWQVPAEEDERPETRGKPPFPD